MIELLVVVAVIAVLVSIMVPVVSTFVVKSRAAVDAANLRILSAEAAANYSDGRDDTEGMIHFTAPNTFTVVNAPAAKTKGFENSDITVTFDASTMQITAKYGSKDSYFFAEIADTGKIPSEN